ncbi:hypothetical protein SAMN04488688_102752 [Paenibacillus sp. cl141a]|nr:hypothetical protein SAMN04488688_102752 [Paenibacillus sp. cl141a]
MQKSDIRCLTKAFVDFKIILLIGNEIELLLTACDHRASFKSKVTRGN